MTDYNLLSALIVILIFWGIRYSLRQNNKRLRQLKLSHNQYNRLLAAIAPQIDEVVNSISRFEEKYCSWTDLQSKLLIIRSKIDNIVVPDEYQDRNDLHEKYVKILNFLENGENLRK